MTTDTQQEEHDYPIEHAALVFALTKEGEQQAAHAVCHGQPAGALLTHLDSGQLFTAITHLWDEHLTITPAWVEVARFIARDYGLPL